MLLCADDPRKLIISFKRWTLRLLRCRWLSILYATVF